MIPARTIPLLALVAVGCGASEKASGTGAGGSGVVSCATDSQCASGGACLLGICVAPPAAVPGLAIEITPPPEAAATAGLTEFVGIVLDGNPVKLTADESQSVRLSFRDAMNRPVQMNATVAYTLPALIPGRPPLSFETDLVAETSLYLPKAVLDRAATVRLVPRDMASQTSPPFSFVAPPGSDKVLTIPDVFAIRGGLRDAIGNVPGVRYVARAFQGQSMISTVSPLSAGEFVLIIPAAASTTDVNVEIVPEPVTPDGFFEQPTDPWFAFNPFTPSRLTPTSTLTLEPAALAPYIMTNRFVITVVGAEEGRPPVPGTLVRATTKLNPATNSGTSPGGTTRYQRDAVVNEEGIAELDLLPGTSQNPRDYDFRVIPPAQSLYRSYCQSMVPVTAGAPGGTLLPVELKRRPLYAGRVRSADGLPVPQVTVRATRLPGTTTDCSPSPGTTYTVTTGFDGRFKMRLEPDMMRPEPGGYRFDYEPAPGSPVPRLTDFIVQVDDSDDPDVDTVPDEVRLRRGALVDGDVRDNAGKPVARAIVRIFQPRCTTAEACAFPPHLLAETQSDDKGYFRVVMAVP